ncbi:MAG: TetR/AcrR family transcriptional regulator [Anaerolineales bacterium]|jgi:AcrR family transcriptional regulator
MLSNVLEEERMDPRVKRTRNLILTAFDELLPEKGFQSLTVQDITDKAEINRATFYAHFADKYDLLDQSIRQTFRQELEKRTLNACHYTDENLRMLIVTVCEFVSHAHTHCTTAQPQFEALVETQVKKQLQELLQMWLEKEETDVDTNTAATAASWAIYGLILQWNREKGTERLSAEQFADQVFPLIAANLQLAQVI